MDWKGDWKGELARRRGFLAELQHQSAVAARNRQRAQAAAIREAQAQQRDAERARAAAERARLAAERADARERAAAEREARQMELDSREAQVASMNADLASTLADIDSVLEWTLGVDDAVDLEALRQRAVHPPFTSSHQAPITAPPPVEVPPEPTFVAPPPPSGMGALFGKKKHAQAVNEARATFEQQHAAWQAEAAAVPIRQREQRMQYDAADAERQARLAADRAAYDAECQKRQAQVDAQNAQLDALIAALAVGEKQAVEDYFSIVFGNSVYPDVIQLEIQHSYSPADKELTLDLRLPRPESLPGVRAYKYVRSSDRIDESPQSTKEQRDRYTKLVHAIVLRTLHEVWESDQGSQVETISLTAGVDHIDPATGQPTTTPLVAAAVHRDTFEEINLARVTPAETLKHLKAVVSKNPYALTPIAISDGVRG